MVHPRIPSALILMVLSIAVCAFSSQPISSILNDLQGLPLLDFFDESFRQLSLRDPEAITAWGLSDYFGGADDHLTNISVAYTTDTMELEAGILELLSTYDRSCLDEPVRGWYDTYQWFLDDLVKGHPFRFHNYPVNGFLDFGVPGAIEALFSGGHPLQDPEDVESYLKRLSLVPEKMDQLIEGMKYRLDREILAPRFILQSGIEKIDSILGITGRLISGADDISVLWIPALRWFKQQMNANPSFSQDERAAWQEAAQLSFQSNYISPMWTLRACIVEWLRTAPDEGGASRMPNGDSFFEYCLHHETSTSLTSAEIHKLGLREIERIVPELRAQYAALGFSGSSSLFELSLQARAGDRIFNPQTENGLNDLFSHFAELLEKTQQIISPFFNLQPAQQVALAPAPPDAGSNYYLPPTWDGSRPGTFYVATSGRWAESQLMVVFHHEAVPGHHLHQALAVELDLPMFMRYWISNGMREGWGLYCERLMYELGMYEERPLENLARLDLELLRAARLVVDTGIHALGWTRQQASTYMEELLGFPSGFFAYEIERYVLLPGQASGYMVGMLKIQEWRDLARSSLGERFDLAGFHDVVLGSGGIPLEVLETLVDQYIKSSPTQQSL